MVVDGKPTGLAFHGVPSGHEFNSFVRLYNAAGPGQPLGDDHRTGKVHCKPAEYHDSRLAHLHDVPGDSARLPTPRPQTLPCAPRPTTFRIFLSFKDQYGAMSVPCIVINRGGEQTVEFGKKSILRC